MSIKVAQNIIITMANNAVVKEEIEIKDEISEDLPLQTTDPSDIQNIIIQNNANGIIGTDNNISGIFSTETVGSQTLVVFRRLPGPLPEPVIQKSIIECNQCGKFLNRGSLELHLQICTKYFDGQNYSFKTKDLQSLVEHKKQVHSNSNSVAGNVCQKCKKVFKTPFQLKYHTNCCEINLAHYCDMCPYKTIRKKSLTFHIQRVHNVYNDDITMKKLTHEGKFIRFCSKCNMIMKSNSSKDCLSCGAACHLRCKQCSKIFTFHKSLIYHLEAQCNPEGYYHCPKCQFRSGYFGNVRNHMRLHLKSEPTFDLNNIEWKEVSRDANGELPLHTCSTCGMMFPKTRQLNQHIAKCGKSPIFQSVNTNATSNSKSDKDKNLRMTYVNKKILLHCERCNKDIEDDRYFYRKKCEHCQTNVRFRCTICDKLFTLHSRAVAHLHLACDPQEMIQCSNCDFKAYTNSQILQHYRVFHSDIPMMDAELPIQYSVSCKKERTFQCAHCPYKGKFKGNIRHHLKTCREKQSIDINENPAPNSNDSQQNKGPTVQRKVYHFCFICNKRKVFPYRLKNCERCKNVVHLWCTICDKAFGIDNPKACEHIKTCLNTYIHECKRCARYFSSLDKLVFHTAHQCSKKIIYYSCSFCKSTFCNEKNLLKHEQRKHSKNSKRAALTSYQEKSTFIKVKKKSSFFSCQKCSAKFVENTDYSRHLKHCEAKLNMQCKVLLTPLKID